jgi:hypothetical protein
MKKKYLLILIFPGIKTITYCYVKNSPVSITAATQPSVLKKQRQAYEEFDFLFD